MPAPSSHHDQLSALTRRFPSTHLNRHSKFLDPLITEVHPRRSSRHWNPTRSRPLPEGRRWRLLARPGCEAQKTERVGEDGPAGRGPHVLVSGRVENRGAEEEDERWEEEGCEVPRVLFRVWGGASATAVLDGMEAAYRPC